MCGKAEGKSCKKRQGGLGPDDIRTGMENQWSSDRRRMREEDLGRGEHIWKPSAALGIWRGASLERKGNWRRSWCSMTPNFLCSPLMGPFNQRPVDACCVELQYRGSLEGGWLRSTTVCFLPGRLSERRTPAGAGGARFRTANSVSMPKKTGKCPQMPASRNGSQSYAPSYGLRLSGPH